MEFGDVMTFLGYAEGRSLAEWAAQNTEKR